MSADPVDMPILDLTGRGNWFEDFEPGLKLRHARGATVGEFENNYLSKAVMNTAQGHWNEHYTETQMLGGGRIVFGLLTASIVIGLTSQDTAENALAEIGLDAMRFTSPVHHGDTLYAYTEVLTVSPAPGTDDAGMVRFRHWGVNQHQTIVFQCERTVLVRRRMALTKPNTDKSERDIDEST